MVNFKNKLLKLKGLENGVLEVMGTSLINIDKQIQKFNIIFNYLNLYFYYFFSKKILQCSFLIGLVEIIIAKEKKGKKRRSNKSFRILLS